MSLLNSQNELTFNDFELLKNKFKKISYEVYINGFLNEITEKEKQDISKLMALLASVPKELNLEFCKFLFERIDLPSAISLILFASMNNINKININKKYQMLVYELRYSPKSLNVLKTICSVYGIKICEKKIYLANLK